MAYSTGQQILTVMKKTLCYKKHYNINAIQWNGWIGFNPSQLAESDQAHISTASSVSSNAPKR